MNQPVHVKVVIFKSVNWPREEAVPALEKRPYCIHIFWLHCPWSQLVKHCDSHRVLSRLPEQLGKTSGRPLWRLPGGQGRVTGQSNWSWPLGKKQRYTFFLGVSGESKPTHAQIPPGSQSVGDFPISRYHVSSPLYHGQFCLGVDTGSGLPTRGGTLRRCYQVFTCILSTGCVSFQDRGWHVDSPRMWAGC